MLAPLRRLAPDPRICSLPSRDWQVLKRSTTNSLVDLVKNTKIDEVRKQRADWSRPKLDTDI
eukprot:676508-Prorocentrum_minimum.AAC.1